MYHCDILVSFKGDIAVICGGKFFLEIFMRISFLITTV